MYKAEHKLKRFYSERDNLMVDSKVVLPEKEAKHIRDVLRLSPGDQIIIFNGNREFRAELRQVKSDFVHARIFEELPPKYNQEFAIHLYQGMIKNPNFELILQKATELGATSITPMITEYTQIPVDKFTKKYQRWERIVTQACKQSNRTDIPNVESAIELETALETAHNKLMFTTSPKATKQIPDLHSQETEELAIFVGPEGGFSETEIDLATSKNVSLVNLGGFPILKADTAAIFATGLINYMHNQQ